MTSEHPGRAPGLRTDPAVGDRLGGELGAPSVEDWDLDDSLEDLDELDDFGDDDDDGDDGEVGIELIVLAMAGTTVSGDGAAEIPGAREVIDRFRAAGASVALTTSSAPAARDEVIASLGWQDLADLVLSPEDAGRGVPAPDLALTALMRTGTSAVDAMVVVGGTAHDIESGVNAGAGLVVGVLTGADGREALEAAGAHEIVDSILELPVLLGIEHASSAVRLGVAG